MRKSPSGFTLIELMVIIAIIGILAGVILTSLASARNKAKDARIKADVKSTRTLLELGFNGTQYPDLWAPSSGSVVNGSVSDSGPNRLDLNALQLDAQKQGGIIQYRAINSTGQSPNLATAYALYGKLVSNPGKYFCLDSVGNVKDKIVIDYNKVTCPQ